MAVTTHQRHRVAKKVAIGTVVETTKNHHRVAKRLTIDERTAVMTALHHAAANLAIGRAEETTTTHHRRVAKTAVRSAKFALSLLIHLQCVVTSGGWRTSGLLEPRSGSDLAYVGKFCFDYVADRASGVLEINIDGDMKASDSLEPASGGESSWLPAFPPAPGGLWLAVFSDATDRWKAARRQWKTLSCVDFMKNANVVRAVTPALPAGKFKVNVTVGKTDRPRFLYFTFVFCDTSISNDSSPITYQIHARNILAGFEQEFSVEDMGSLQLQGIGFVSFVLVLMASFSELRLFTHGFGVLRPRPLLRLLLFSCASSSLGCLACAVHDIAYSNNGEGLGAADVLGELLACLARLTLSMLQLYIASGKALLKSPDEVIRRFFLSLLVLGIVAVTMGCELYGRYFGDLDWSTTLYFYESWPGLLMMTLNTVLFTEVCRATCRLYRQGETSPPIRRFYMATFVSALFYFITLPATCALAHVLHPWERKKVVAWSEMAARLAATAILAQCLRPSRLDSMISARLESPDMRQNAVELAEGLS